MQQSKLLSISSSFFGFSNLLEWSCTLCNVWDFFLSREKGCVISLSLGHYLYVFFFCLFVCFFVAMSHIASVPGSVCFDFCLCLYLYCCLSLSLSLGLFLSISLSLYSSLYHYICFVLFFLCVSFSIINFLGYALSPSHLCFICLKFGENARQCKMVVENSFARKLSTLSGRQNVLHFPETGRNYTFSDHLYY